MKQQLTLLLLLLLLAIGADAQTASGTVKDTSGEPLIGVTVSVKGQKAGAVTDFDGNFNIDAAQGSTLLFSYIGYQPQEVKYLGTPLSVTMKEDNAMLNEVVVVGYGTMKRSDITGSTVSVTADDMKKSVATSLDQALQGRAAGVQVTQNSGTPGGGISVSIRGTNSLNGNEPLYIIDGIAVQGQTGDNGAGGDKMGNTNALSGINPADIVSMEVLKDASATAIYGSRASNGVVIITTKRGQANTTKVSYDGSVGWQTMPKKLGVLNLREYAQFYNERAAILGYGEREEFANPSILGEGTDWQDEIFRTALMHNHQVSLSGGTDKVRYAASGGYLGQDGIVLGSDFNRATARVNLDVDAAKWLSFGINSSLSTYKQTNTIEKTNVNSLDDNVLMIAVKQYPDVPVRNADGTFGYVDKSKYDTGGTPISNPVSDALTRERYNKGTDVSFNAFGDIKFYRDLTLHVEYGQSLNFNKTYAFVPFYDFGTYVQQSSGSRDASQSRYSSFKTYLTYNHSWGSHSLNVMAGHEAQESRWENLNASRDSYKFNSVHELGSGDASTAKNGSGVSENAIESYYGRLNYNISDRYLLTATMRADGSSAFGPNNRWGYFPSVALAWRASQETFLKDVSWLNNLKLRLGWGLVGNQNAGNYAYGATMATVSTIWGAGYYMSNFSNSNLKWEKTNSYNVGIDLSLLRNRVELIFDAYVKKTDNLLMHAPLPSYVVGSTDTSSGLITSPWVNVGAMQNKGFEFTLNTVPVSTKAIEWRSAITFSLNRNKVTQLYTDDAAIAGNIGGQLHTYTTVGNPVGQFYGYKSKGIFSSEDDFYLKDKNGDYMYDKDGSRRMVAIPEGQNVKEGEVWYGDYIWEDLNGDGVINEKDRTYIGNPNPDFTFGFTNTLTYRGFDLSVFINGSVGNDVYNYMNERLTNPYDLTGKLSINKDYARVELIDPNGSRTLQNMHVSNAATARVQRITTSSANTNNRVSDRFVEDGSYLRVKNITLGYTLPSAWVKRLQLSNVRIYASLQNLFTITGYSGYDPEIGAYNQDVKLQGIDFARYPSQKIYTVGISINY